MALNFITVTPRQLIEKEGAEAKSVVVNMFTLNGKDLLGHKEDFRYTLFCKFCEHLTDIVFI